MSLSFLYHERNLDGKIINNYKGKGDSFKEFKLNYYLEYKQKQISIKKTDKEAIFNKTKNLLNYYRDIDSFLGKNKWITTQSKVRSTILEEFCGWLFKDIPIIKKIGLNFYNKKIFAGVAIDSSGSVYPKTKDVDFCIGKEITAYFEKKKYNVIIPIIAIECKTWLDKTMFSEAQFTAQKLKQGTPNVKVYILSGYSGISKSEIPNKGQTPIDQIFLIGDTRRNINPNVVWEFFKEINEDLKKVTEDKKIQAVGKLLPE